MMLARMEMAEGLDHSTLQHGQEMVERDRELIEETTSGPSMEAVHSAGPVPHMDETHQLAEAMLEVASLVEQMDAFGATPDDSMTLHHVSLQRKWDT